MKDLAHFKEKSLMKHHFVPNKDTLLFSCSIFNMGKLSYSDFEGKYLNDCKKEFPKDWFSRKILRKYISGHRINKMLSVKG